MLGEFCDNIRIISELEYFYKMYDASSLTANSVRVFLGNLIVLTLSKIVSCVHFLNCNIKFVHSMASLPYSLAVSEVIEFLVLMELVVKALGSQDSIEALLALLLSSEIQYSAFASKLLEFYRVPQSTLIFTIRKVPIKTVPGRIDLLVNI